MSDVAEDGSFSRSVSEEKLRLDIAASSAAALLGFANTGLLHILLIAGCMHGEYVSFGYAMR